MLSPMISASGIPHGKTSVLLHPLTCCLPSCPLLSVIIHQLTYVNTRTHTHTHTHTLVILLPCFTRVCATRMFVCLNFGCRPKSDVSHPNFVSCHLDTVTGVARQFHAYYSTSCPSPSDKGYSESLASSRSAIDTHTEYSNPMVISVVVCSLRSPLAATRL
jgi:hypothetical protein